MIKETKIKKSWMRLGRDYRKLYWHCIELNRLLGCPKTSKQMRKWCLIISHINQIRPDLEDLMYLEHYPVEWVCPDVFYGELPGTECRNSLTKEEMSCDI